MVGQIEDNPQNARPKDFESLKMVYFDFLKDFREYLSEYVRESVIELVVAQIPVREIPLKLFTGVSRGKAKIKNQGKNVCYISTNEKQLGYRLDPDECIELFVNNHVFVTTVSGNTDIGIIRY